MVGKVFSAIDDGEHSGYAADAAIKIARDTSSMLIFFMANPAILPGRDLWSIFGQGIISTDTSLRRDLGRGNRVYMTSSV